MMLVCVAALAPALARSQAHYDEETGVTGPFVWNIGGTLSIPLGPTDGRQTAGGGFTIGLTFNPTIPFGVGVEYGANWSSLKTGRLANAGVGGNVLMQYFDLNATIRPIVTPRSAVYLIAGGGYYYRGVDVTRVTGTALAPYCDPWLYYCSVVPVSTSSILGSRSSWDWGLDAGLGVSYMVSPPVRIYAEVRYHYIFGPSFTDQGGTRRSADGQFLPLTLGIKF